MKGKSGQVASGRSSGGPGQAEDIALAAFNRLVAEPARLAGFLSVTGLRPDTIRDAATSPEFFAAILDYVSSDEELLVAIAGELDMKPAEFAAATARLSPRGDFEG